MDGLYGWDGIGWRVWTRWDDDVVELQDEEKIDGNPDG